MNSGVAFIYLVSFLYREIFKHYVFSTLPNDGQHFISFFLLFLLMATAFGTDYFREKSSELDFLLQSELQKVQVV